METIIACVITGVLSLIGVMITNYASNTKMQMDMKTAQAVTDTKIEELTREVREHNNFARRMPVVEEKMSAVVKEVDSIKKKLDL